MMDETFIKAIQDGTATGVVRINGMEYATAAVHNPPPPWEPEVRPLKIESLTGLVDYVKDGSRDSIYEHELFIHVRSELQVTLLSKLKGANRTRDMFMLADIPACGFPFDKFISHAAFVIGLQSQFLDYGDRAKVLKAVGTIRDESVKTSMDDGVTQRVTAAAGVALAAEVALPNPVTLKPWRTFREVDQPPSSFVLRVQANKGLPDVALFEADGGQWRREAVRNIAEFLKERLSGITILA